MHSVRDLCFEVSGCSCTEKIELHKFYFGLGYLLFNCSLLVHVALTIRVIHVSIISVVGKCLIIYMIQTKLNGLSL